MNNPQIELARKVVETTGTHLFLTGKAGTGKTTFLRRLCCDLPKRMVVLAPTGIAAINAGGVTIHSFFQLPFAPYVPGANYASGQKYSMNKQKLKLIRSLDLLVIDEISMVRADLLDAVDDALRKYRRSREPFGGVQLLFIGDLQQLAPVVREEEWGLLRNYYATPYFFSSLALQRTQYVTIELEQVYRQSDERFLALLNSVREGKADPQVLEALNCRYIPGFRAPKEEGYIQLVTHNHQAQHINQAELEQLPGQAFTYEATVSGKFPDYAFPTDEVLTLKQGAQVMFVKNAQNKEYFNGMIGEVVSISRNGFSVRANDAPEKVIDVQPEEWTNTRYGLDEATNEIREIVDGTFRQFPVKQAWAITIHKSQGLTFERVIIDASAAFAFGQTYVALSRCKTLEGIVLTSPIPPGAIIADAAIDSFNAEMRNRRADERSLDAMRQTYGLHLLNELFAFDKERISFAQVTRLLEEFLSRVYPDTLRTYQARLSAYDLEVMSVASRFQLQYKQMLAAEHGDLSAESLQERIRKGAAYFLGKLRENRDLVQATQLGIDNKEVAKRMKTACEEWQAALTAHIRLLEKVKANGFRLKDYLNERAQALLDAEGGSGKNAGKPTKTNKKAETATEKLAVPSEVKNAALYYRLQTWRKQKSAELHLPAYTVLQTKSLLAMANYAPTNAQELAQIPYFGSRGMEKYGAELLALIQKYLEEKDQGKVDETETIQEVSRPGEKTYETSLRLFKEGKRPEEIATMRDLTPATVLGHLARYVPTGEVAWDDLMRPDHFERIRDYFAAHPYTAETRLVAVRAELGEDISFPELNLALRRLELVKP